MTRTEYANKVKKIVESVSLKKVEIKEIQKDNTMMLGLIVKEIGSNIAPTFYVDNFIDKPVEEMADFILNFRNTEVKESDMDNVNKIITSREEILNRVTFKLLNKERNRNVTSVYRDLGNGLIAKLYIGIDDITDGAKIAITQQILENNDLTEYEVFEQAKANITKELNVKNLGLQMAEMMGMPIELLDINTIPAYIITNNKMNCGASAVYSYGLHDQLKELIGDFLLLPSSIHEFIAVPKDDYETYKSMVMEVNSTVLQDDEFLSDEIYELKEDDLIIASF